jgi:serine protease Do
LPYFDVFAAARQPLAQAGDWVLAFSNQFKIATRDEPLSVQHGVVAAYSKLHGRRGIFEAPYTGDVYVVDAITNNPGAAGGVLTTRKGALLGLLGKELRNTLTDTWINYAVPIQARVDITSGDKKSTIDLVGFVEKAMKGEYKPIVKDKTPGGPGGYHGIVLVPSPVERTPPFVEAVERGSPAQRAGLKPDDLIVYVDGETVPSVKTFRDLIARARPGTTVQLEVRRTDTATGTDKLITVKLKLEERAVQAAPVPKSPN